MTAYKLMPSEPTEEIIRIAADDQENCAEPEDDLRTELYWNYKALWGAASSLEGDTPEVDSFEKRIEIRGQTGWADAYFECLATARKLERERNALLAKEKK